MISSSLLFLLLFLLSSLPVLSWTTLVTPSPTVQLPCDAVCRVQSRAPASSLDGGAYSWRNCSMLSDTLLCNTMRSNFSYDRACTDADLTFTISTRAHQVITDNIDPHTKMNVSMVVHDRVTTVFLELECLYASDHQDAYCHNHSKQKEAWGRMIWPCRAFDLSGLDSDLQLRSPLRFDYNCHRIFSGSHYLLNVSLVPQMCRSSYLLTIPHLLALHPELEKHFGTGDKGPNWASWAPLVVVDRNPDDGIWVRFEPPTGFLLESVTVELYKLAAKNEAQHRVRVHVVQLPTTGIKLLNLASGDYIVYVYVDRQDCQLFCPPSSHCQSCANTSLNFTLGEARWTKAWRRWYAFVSVVKYIGFAVIGILIILAMLIVALIFYLRHRKRQVSRRVQFIQLTQRPKVLLLYSDDCAQHSAAVAELGHLLKLEANADVHLDQWAIDTCGLSPNQWMLRTLESVDFYLVVMSAGTHKVFEGHRLLQRRHYPDLFSVGVTGVMQELHTACLNRPPQSTSLLSKFIFARFDYSPADCFEPFLSRLPCARFVLPHDVLPLIGQLHSVGSAHTTIDRSHPPNTAELETAVAGMRRCMEREPDWLDGRVAPTDDVTGQRQLNEVWRDLDLLPARSTPAIVTPDVAFRTALEQPRTNGTAAAPYVLSAPDHEEQANLLPSDDTTSKYRLVGDPDQLSDSD